MKVVKTRPCPDNECLWQGFASSQETLLGNAVLVLLHPELLCQEMIHIQHKAPQRRVSLQLLHLIRVKWGR